MTRPAYYNEFDPHAAQWLRNLIAAGHIAPGDVDERSIEDVRPDDLVGYGQCHFFAGIGVWSYALRAAGWPDDRPIWTGSCPCQPFSSAGEGEGFADERHLWPHFFYLIEQRQPAVVVGEQVASRDADPWVDLVQDDLEGVGYAFGAVPFPSAGVGAPHIRDRLYWAGIDPRSLGDAQRSRLEGLRGDGHHGDEPGRFGAHAARPVAAAGAAGGLADVHGERLGEAWSGGVPGGQAERTECGGDAGERLPGPTNGLWRAADWLLCRDGKWRPVEPGTFPLAHGAPARVGRLRAYGNAINAEAAIEFLKCVMGALA